MTGVGYRREMQAWLQSRPPAVTCLELTAEHFFDEVPPALVLDYPLLVHGLGLSLGTPGPLVESDLKKFCRVAERARALWVSEHAAFTRSAAVDLGHLNPVPATEANVHLFSEHAAQVMAATQRPLLLENIASFWRPRGDFDEPEFLNELCARSQAGLLLDVTNLYVNSRNHRFCPFEWLARLEKKHVRQLHVVGYSHAHGRWHDRHAEAIQPDLWELIEHVLRHTQPAAVIIERDQGPLDFAQLEDELVRLAEIA